MRTPCLLDAESSSNPLLDLIIADKLRRLYLIANVPARRMVPPMLQDAPEEARDGLKRAKRQSIDHGRRPTDDLSADSLCVRFLERYVACWNHRGRLLVILEAQQEAQRLARGMGAHDPDEWKRQIVRDARSGRELAVALGLDRRTVDRIRKDPRWGGARFAYATGGA